MFFVAALYSSVGHGGASGYLAVLTLLAAPRLEMATTALVLNVFVAGVAWVTFARAGRFSLSLTWPFIVLSVPAAFLGGALHVAGWVYSLALAAALLMAAWRLSVRFAPGEKREIMAPSLSVAIPTGAGIGLVSGIVGIGGGVFLSPIIILSRLASPREAAATSALFIVVNSLAGLAGRLTRAGFQMGALWPLIFAGFAGGLVGSRFGANKFSNTVLRRTLAVVLVVAAGKLILNATA